MQNLTLKQLIVHIPKITTAAPSPPQHIQVQGPAYLSFYTGGGGGGGRPHMHMHLHTPFKLTPQVR